MHRVLAIKSAELLQFDTFRHRFFIACGRIIPTLTFRTGKVNNLSGHDRLSPRIRTQTEDSSSRCAPGPQGPSYSIISVTRPAPTVRPPSRIANRRNFSMAIGEIRVTSMLILSPGMTISTPSGRVMSPVTSVVLK